MDGSARKRRKLLDDEDEASRSAQAASRSHTPKPARRTLTALAPPTPLTNAATGNNGTPARHPVSKAPLSHKIDKGKSKAVETSQAARRDTASASSRSGFQQAASAFPTVAQQIAGASRDAEGRHQASPLRPSIADPFAATPKKPPDRPFASSLLSRAPVLAAATSPSKKLGEDGDLKPARMALPLVQKGRDSPGKVGTRHITDLAPSVEPAVLSSEMHEELSSPRKRKGGGLLANGFAQQAVEVLNRARTDHALWQHGFARRLGARADQTATVEQLRDIAQPDLRLQILSTSSGLSGNGPRLVATCAILDDHVIPSSQATEHEESRDIGTVAFSLAMHPANYAGPSARPRTKSESEGAKLTPIDNPLDLSLLVAGAEVWVFEPWSDVALGEEDDTGAVERRALVCTRFAVLRK